VFVDRYGATLVYLGLIAEAPKPADAAMVNV
jgi:hypothetical protein